MLRMTLNTVASRLPPQHNTRYQVRHFLTYSLSHRDRGSDVVEYAIDNMEEQHCLISLQVPSMLSLDPSSSRYSVVFPRDVVGQYHLSGVAEHAKLCYEGYEICLLEQSQYRAQVISTSLGPWVCNNFRAPTGHNSFAGDLRLLGETALFHLVSCCDAM